MQSVALVCTVFVLTIASSNGYIPRMLHGRPKGGFLGRPGYKHHNGLVTLPPTPPEQWFTQTLNHFNGADTRTWKQRFFVNDTFYKPGGPLFVQIGGEGTANPIWLVEGAWVGYGQSYNAYLALLEHRFYGKSHPTSDMSVDNLQYLSSEQALADLAAFISNLKKQLNNPKVITFGGSYPGSLSAWFRMKYPHLVDGAVASSAPLLAKVNFMEYLKVVDASLRTFPPSGVCTDPIAMATQDIQKQLQTYEGRKMLKEKFKLCDDIDINISKDISNLFANLAGNFEGVVQYNKDNRAFEGAVDANITIDVLCEIMSNGHVGTPTDRYAMVSNKLLEVYGTKCFDFKYDKMIEDLKKTDWNSSAAEGGRQWTYQTCTEFAFYQSSDYAHQPFGHAFPIDFSLQQCADIYGPQFGNTTIANAVQRSNQDYGALGIKISKVLFPNGSIDPWHALGVLRDLGPDARAIFIKGTAHCANMYPASHDDLPGLTQAREEIETTIGQWLKA